MDHGKPKNIAQKSAQAYFTKEAQRDESAKHTRKKERSATEAKTAKLRELRLAKEAADKADAEKVGADSAGANTPKRKPAAKRSVTRFTY